MRNVPKHIINKVERMARLMDQLVELNIEVEEWMEKNGIDDAFDFTRDYRDDRGYGISFPYDFIAKVERRLNEGTVEM